MKLLQHLFGMLLVQELTCTTFTHTLYTPHTQLCRATGLFSDEIVHTC